MEGKWGSDLGLSARMVLTMVLVGRVRCVYRHHLALRAKHRGHSRFCGTISGSEDHFSDRVVLATSGAHIVREDEAPELHSAIERLCAMADLPKPKVAIAKSAVPNAFATGRNQNHAVVAVTSSLLQRLDEPEVEAVLAHELSHVKNRDMLVMTIASFVTTIAGFLMRFWFFMGVGGNRRDNNIFLFFIALAAIWITSFLITRALSRYREDAADRGSAIITAHPANLASALLKISGNINAFQRRISAKLRV